jgi:nitrogen fixation/metabolism regulation signal transduction histidine kinase
MLGRLSSGVLTLDRRQNLRAVNNAASQIVGVDLEAMLGSNLAALKSAYPFLEPLVAVLTPRLAESELEWREEVRLIGKEGHKVLMCRGASLPGVEDMPGGYVVVFDDVTALIQAQRDAAWGEVARRLAHEIKNPLTPIQLSAERLRRKYLGRMAPEDDEVLDRATHTIVQQVQSMKEMVQAFSEYARSPTLELHPLDLKEVVAEVLELYRGHSQRVTLELTCDDHLPLVEADTDRIRQLLNNLLTNAVEATSEVPEPRIQVSLRGVAGDVESFVELRVADNGHSIPVELLDKLFEPYVTTKLKGSGIGLAVVKRIVEEHAGNIWAENLAGGGACLTVRLPAAAGARQPAWSHEAITESPPLKTNEVAK